MFQPSFPGLSGIKETIMLKMFFEEAAALTSLVLFVGTVAVWAHLIPQL
ncbi:hypothetical protein GCM10022626_25210 [[Pseudomonas] carboxydohydrogena]